MEIFEPLDAGYKGFRPAANPYLNAQFALKSSKEKLEIRYKILPWEEHNPNASNPNIQAFVTLSNIASNADDAIISAIQPSQKSMLHDFNADWGISYFFKPKAAFSHHQHCRMVALCKEGKGTAFIFYLFDDPNNKAVDIRYNGMRFYDDAPSKTETIDY